MSRTFFHYVRGSDLATKIEADYALTTAADPPILSIISEGEIRSLALQFGWGPAKQRALSDLLSKLVIVPLDKQDLIGAYAQIDFFSERAGRSMGKNDAWIAATAYVTAATLLTTDRDFDPLDPAFLRRDWINPITD